MITQVQGIINFSNVLNWHDNKRSDFIVATNASIDKTIKTDNMRIDGSDLLMLPALTDPHVHFRTPGITSSEDWLSGAVAAFRGGYTCVFDMPNTIPPTTTVQRLKEKCAIIEQQISTSCLPLDYRLFFGADKTNFHQIPLLCGYNTDGDGEFYANNDLTHYRSKIVGIKVFMGSSTGELLMDDLSSLHALYALAGRFNLIVALHAEDECTIRQNTVLYSDILAKKASSNVDFKYHSKIRSVDAALKSISQVIMLSKIYNVASYILHVSSKSELELIKQAKQEGIKIYAETCPHYLFMDDSYYTQLGPMAKMNPPLRTASDREYLWQAVNDGVIDTIGSDHAPHSKQDKQLPLGKCPSGIPGIETSLALMLTAYKDGLVTLPRVVELMSKAPRHIFSLAPMHDSILVDINNYRLLKDEDLATKVKWSPYSGRSLTGFVKYVIKNQQVFSVT